MTDTDSTPLRGLPGDNPLGFLAALGVQAALAEQDLDHKLRWTDDPIPHPVVSPALGLEGIANVVLAASERWLSGPALSEALDPKLKLKPPHIREYLSCARSAGASGSLAWCLLAEDSLDNGGAAKPSALYFTAGQMKFVTMARTILSEVTEAEIVDDIARPWRYNSERGSLMWDCVDDRDHALSAADPTDKSRNPKLTNPGAEALAIVGLSRYPCFASPEGTVTQGCSGSWKRGTFTWPLWTVPATVRSVRSLLSQVAASSGNNGGRTDWYRAWGVHRVLQSQIRRSDQGGYGTFGPPRVVWQRE